MKQTSSATDQNAETLLQPGKTPKLTAAERQRTYRQRHPEKVKASQQAWREKNKEYDQARKQKWREQNPEYGRQWIADNENRMQHLRRAWKESNPHRLLARDARRRATKKNATPTWADHERIVQVYADAKSLSDDLGIQFEVDHIVPLQGKLVCGLHWEGNLQIIPANDNRKKANKFAI